MTVPKPAPAWRKLCQEALSELDPQNLPEKIARAEMAIDLRLKELKASPKNQAEQQALRDALESLNALKRLHFPGWNPRTRAK
jgi:hypothetical protein